MKFASSVLIVISMLALAACEKKPDASALPVEAEVPVRELKPVRGATVEASGHSFPRFLRVTGQLAAKSDSIVAADSPGKVVEASVERGSVVKAGDVLARLDDRQPRLTLEEATAAVDVAKTRLELATHEQKRNQPLAESKVIADSDYQRLLTEVTARRAEVAANTARRDQAQKMLDDCLIRTPFAGVVAERAVDVGEFVGPGSPVARVVESAELRLVLNVPETEVAGLVVGQKVEFTTAAFTDRQFVGTLKYIGAAMREISRDLVVEAMVDNAKGELRPGFFCDARILLREEKAVSVPLKAVRVDGTKRKVFVIQKDQTLSERLVEVGETRDGRIEIRRGLKAGESLLAAPDMEAADGLSFQPAA